MRLAARRQRSLVRVVARQIILYALIAMGLQVAIVVADYYFDDAELARLVVGAEASALLGGFSSDKDGLRYGLPGALGRYAARGTGYFARIRTASGTILFSNCDASCSRRLLPPDLNPPDSWLRQLEPGKPITVAGGRSYEVGGERVLVELAILSDRDGVVWTVLGHELVDHMAVPMALMLVFVLGATLLAVRHALRPVVDAAARAGHIDPLDASTRLRLEGMPREISHLGAAVNLAISRIAEVIRAQKVFTAALAHEIRTPLAMVRLQLGRIDDPRARSAETDLLNLTHLVNQLTSLARLEAVDPGALQLVDPVVLGRSLVAAMAPWVYEADHGIGFADGGGAPFLANPGLVEDALRNLIENAVRHTRPGTQITIEAGPGRRLAVVDDAGAYPDDIAREGCGPGFVKQAGGVGIGLQIVRRIAQLHGARFEIERVPGVRTSASLVFPRGAQAEAYAPVSR